MIQEEYCSFEVAKLLKEKGFNCPVKKYYSLFTEDINNNLQRKYGANKNWNSFDLSVSMPSQSLVMRWLREKYSKIIQIHYGNVGHPDDPQLQWWWELLNIKGEFCECNITLGNKSYEEACEAAIKYCLEHLI